MTAVDFTGWIAAAFTLLTFSLRSMMSLRIAAVAANVCFITYGAMQELYPVIALHGLLIPSTHYSLLELLRDARQDADPPHTGRRPSRRRQSDRHASPPRQQQFTLFEL